jgi:nicotinamidase-related amidase
VRNQETDLAQGHQKLPAVCGTRKEHHMTEAKTSIAPSLFQPDNHAVLLIDYQYLQLVTACSHNPEGVIAAATLLARGAKLFNVPTFLTTGLAERQGLVREVAAVFPDQTPVDRTNLNAFEDPRVVEWVKKTGKKKLVMGGLWTESCLLMTSLSALHAGYQVYIVVDASSSGSFDSHNAGRTTHGSGRLHSHCGGHVSEGTTARLVTDGNCR